MREAARFMPRKFKARRYPKPGFGRYCYRLHWKALRTLHGSGAAEARLIVSALYYQWTARRSYAPLLGVPPATL
jgi:hypothetical protein